VGPAGGEAAAGVTVARRAQGMRGVRLGRLLGPKRGARGGELGRDVAGPRREGGRGEGGKAGWPAGPRAKGGQLGQKGRRGRGEKRKRFSFFF
jgi:hypothetical protein